MLLSLFQDADFLLLETLSLFNYNPRTPDPHLQTTVPECELKRPRNNEKQVNRASSRPDRTPLGYGVT